MNWFFLLERFPALFEPKWLPSGEEIRFMQEPRQRLVCATPSWIHEETCLLTLKLHVQHALDSRPPWLATRYIPVINPGQSGAAALLLISVFFLQKVYFLRDRWRSVSCVCEFFQQSCRHFLSCDWCWRHFHWLYSSLIRLRTRINVCRLKHC